MKVLENYTKNILVVFLLKKLSCPIHPPITIPNTDSTANVSFFKIARRASVVESLFSKVKDIYAFYNSVNKSNICMTA